MAPPSTGAREKLLEAAFRVIREKGFTATTVDDLCKAAGVTKGAFFHHFDSKEALGVATARHWMETTGTMFETAPYHAPADALDRVLAYVDFRKAILGGEMAEFTCVAGTMAQEVHSTHPAIAEACGEAITGHAATLVADIAQAMEDHGVNDAGWTAESLALHTQVVLQGAFVAAKGTGKMEVVAESLDHLRRYIELLFPKQDKRESIQ
ncbi:MAG: TetR/AcrR family transcriptional regulator [Pseudomonadota bacterium]|nr:TetR/AcrR family transcriptional regulator [Pseudomonadota bacterium]